MPATFKTAPTQPDFTTETQCGDYVIEYPLGPSEPSALLVKALFMQVRANYARPAVNSNITYASRTAYFIDDIGFKDERGGVSTWERVWATVPASWSEPGGTYAYAFPGFTGGTAFGNICSLTNIAASGANYVISTNATGISAGDDVYFDINYVRTENYHVTFHTPVLAAVASTSVTIPGILPGSGLFSGITGSVRKGAAGRSAATTLEVDSRLLHDYALSSEAALDTDLPQIDRFNPVSYGFGTTGSETTFLTAGTVPSTSQYASMIAAGTEIVATRSERRRYMGNIYERITRLLKAH